MNRDFFAAFAAINHADLTPGQRCHAFALLELAPCGPARLTWDAVHVVMGLDSPGSVRKVLSILKAAGVCTYSAASDAVWVEFLPLPVNSAPDADPCQDESGNEDYRYREQSLPLPVNIRADSATPLVRLVGLDTTTPLESDLKPTKPKPEPRARETAPRHRRPDTEIARSVQLLMDPDVGMGDRAANRLAAAHSFEWILRQTFAYLADRRAGTVNDAGALVYRIDHAFSAGELTQADRASPLYARHVDAETEARRDLDRYAPAEYAGVINS